ncbi:hypothetical protein JD276_08955 [Leucobacter sp. CSA1]|uniref:SF4 helicase domain-containing protein n=1 Tax=Leucobacter chromiisoli TaxID=2796471 RepID=A0A934Q6B9_9MICO|nr:hypothetical protein [Leucobacter chromiisoli]
MHEMVGEIARQLKTLAREPNCPVIMLSQRQSVNTTRRPQETASPARRPRETRAADGSTVCASRSRCRSIHRPPCRCTAP